MSFRPSKWVLYSPVAVLPFLAALFVEGRGLQDDISRRVAENLAKAGSSWAKAGVDGRDIQLAGDAPSAAQMDAAIAATVSTYGVRRVESTVRVVEPPPAAPVISPQSGIWGTFVIGGTWPEGNGNTLSAGLAGQTWTLGKDAQLVSYGAGNWILKPDVAPDPGTYDVTATVTSASGLVSNDTSKDEITIAAPPELKAPTIDSLETASASPVIHGSWDPAVATTLSVSLGPAVYKLGTDAALADAAGNWTLTVPKPLADGSYDVMAEVGDALGRSVKAAVPGKLLVDTAAPAAPVIDPVTAEWPLKVTGSWPGEDAVSLTATLAGKTWTLGKDAALDTDGKGKWSFTPDVELAPGTYDLGIEIADKLGNIARDATRDEIVVAPLPELKAPTVASVITNVPAPVLTGTWPSSVAKSLVVKLRDTAFTLGTSKELTAEGDNWKLQLAAPLTDGDYDVSAEVSDARGRTVTAAAPGKLTIDTVAPAAPVIAPVSGQLPLKANGSWAEGDAVSLVVKLADRVWTLGKDVALASDGKGNWSFAPPDLDLKPGTYDLGVEVTDRAGNVTRDATKDEIVVETPPPPPPVMLAPTVTAAEVLTARPVVKGTWSEIAAKSLQVSIAGTSYVLGTGPELTSDGIGNWTLTLTALLKDGAYDVTVETTDANGLTLADGSQNELVVDAQAPQSPTVKLFAGDSSPDRIAGSWDSANATSLKVSIPAAGIEASLGKDQDLTADATVWSLALRKVLPPTSYDVVVETADKHGRLAKDQTRFEILVKEPLPPPQMKAPTVVAYSGEATPPALAGTWDEGVAQILTVKVEGAGIDAKLRRDAALSTDRDGNWSLALTGKLAPGIYDVAVETGDILGNRISDTTTAELYIKAPPPSPPQQMKAPTVVTYSGVESPAMLNGTWDEGVAKTLSVVIDGAGVSAKLGSDKSLTSDGKGNWTLTLATKLAPGIYDVAVTTGDAQGNAASDASTAELYIKAPPPPPPPPPYDCDAEFAAAVTVLPIRFDFDHWDLSESSRGVLHGIAAVLKDERCLTRSIEVTGHADYLGGKLYNEALSLRRAQVVVDALQSEGVAAGRMQVIGLGESNPEDPQRTRDARARNRRVILTMLK